MGALVIIKRKIDKEINMLPGSPSVYKLQRFALCGIDHFLKSPVNVIGKNITQKGLQKTKVHRMQKKQYCLPSRLVLGKDLVKNCKKQIVNLKTK